MMHRAIRNLGLTGAIFALSCLPILADSASDEADRVALGGVLVEIDRQTGRLIEPSADQVAEIRRTLQQLFHATKNRSHEAAPGTSGADTRVLDERHAVFSIARIDAEGNLSTVCVRGADLAEAQIAKAEGPDSPDGE